MKTFIFFIVQTGTRRDIAAMVHSARHAPPVVGLIVPE
jgi:hypothetical protein